MTISKERAEELRDEIKKPKFELCFCDEMGMEQYNKYFNTREEAMKFINSYEFKNLLKIYIDTDRMIFDLETNNVIWEYKTK